MKTCRFILAVLMVLASTPVVYAKPNGSKVTVPVTQDSGNQRDHYKVRVGSNAATAQPYDCNQTIAGVGGVRDQLLQNQGPSTVAVSSWSAFSTNNDAYTIITASSPGIVLQAGASYYMKTLDGQTSSWMMITVEGEKSK